MPHKDIEKRRAYMKAYSQTPKCKAYEMARRQTPERKAYMKAWRTNKASSLQFFRALAMAGKIQNM